MGDSEKQSSEQADTDDELRTIAFRLREIQRLLSIRAEQENRRLDAEGIDPVSETEFFRANAPEEDE